MNEKTLKDQHDIDNMERREHFDRVQKTLWYGPEIEYTRHFGKPTLCIRGVPAKEDIDAGLAQFPEINHCFFGGPYDNELGLFQDPEELATIDYYLNTLLCDVTIQMKPEEMHGNLLAFLLQNKDNEQLCIFVPCQVPHLLELGARVDVKLDDPEGVGGPNGGVWVMSADEFQDVGGRTNWESYDVDILIK